MALRFIQKIFCYRIIFKEKKTKKQIAKKIFNNKPWNVYVYLAWVEVQGIFLFVCCAFFYNCNCTLHNLSYQFNNKKWMLLPFYNNNSKKGKKNIRNHNENQR